jgi:hypothetical protein
MPNQNIAMHFVHGCYVKLALARVLSAYGKNRITGTESVGFAAIDSQGSQV